MSARAFPAGGRGMTWGMLRRAGMRAAVRAMGRGAVFFMTRCSSGRSVLAGRGVFVRGDVFARTRGFRGRAGGQGVIRDDADALAG